MVFASHGEEWRLGERASTVAPSAARGRRREFRMRNSRFSRISPRSWMLALYVLTIVIVVLTKAFSHRGPDNNFLVFRWSYLNLAAGHDMYAAQPQHHADLYKYSPSFALLFAPFALIPFTLSLALWDALNTLLLFFAVDRLLPGRRGIIALALIYLEALRSMQRSQSNSLV